MIFQQYTTDSTQNEYDIGRHCSNSTISVGVVLKCHKNQLFKKVTKKLKSYNSFFGLNFFPTPKVSIKYAEYVIKTTAGIRSAKRQGAMCKMQGICCTGVFYRERSSFGSAKSEGLHAFAQFLHLSHCLLAALLGIWISFES